MQSTDETKRSVAMERDLVVQAGTVLQDLVGDRLNQEQRTAVEAWLSQQLEAERAGWKQKLNMAMKEIEKERRLALEVHTAIHRLNETIEGHHVVTMYREPTMYVGAEKDMKVSHIVTLQKHLNSMFKVIDLAEEERTKFVMSLAPWNIGDVDSGEGSDVYDTVTLDDVTSKIEHLKTEVLQVKADASETEARLTREIKVLTDTVQMQEGLMKEMKATHEQETNVLRKRNRFPVAKVSSHVTRYDKCVGVSLQPAVRECCIQTDRNLDDCEMNAAPTQTRDNAAESPQPEADTRDGPGLFLKPITEVTFGNKDTFNSPDQSHTNNNNSFLDSSRNGDYSLEALSRALRQPIDAEHLNTSDHVESLRHQVVTFAQKLEQARWKMSEYERQMSLMRIMPRCKRSTGKPINAQCKESSTELTLHRKWKSSDGYLCGVRKDILDTQRHESESIMIKEKKRSRRERTGFSNQGATNTCFRCHLLYRNKENHRMACRYHPKGKQNIERYDSTGKLVKIVQVWECCMQQNEAPGCCVGEHI